MTDSMEWENTDEVMIIKDIPCKSTACKVKNIAFKSKKKKKKAILASKTENTNSESNQPITSLKVHLIVVLDTNILLEPFGYKFCEYFSKIPPDPASNTFQTEITFLIPWIVMQELNAIKDNRNSKKTQKVVSDARCIISFLFRIFSKHKWPKRITNSAFSIGISFKGQSSAENDYRNKVSFVAECEDDAILQCCQTYVTKDHYPNFDQNQNRLKTVILLTNDKGLGIKAIASQIPTHAIKELSEETRVNFDKISDFDVTTFSRVLDFFISKGYDNLTQEFEVMPDAGLKVLNSISKQVIPGAKCVQPESLTINPTQNERKLAANHRAKEFLAKRKSDKLIPIPVDVVDLEDFDATLTVVKHPAEKSKEGQKTKQKEEIFYTQAVNCFPNNVQSHPIPQVAIALEKSEEKCEMDVTPLVHTVYYQDVNCDLSGLTNRKSEFQIPQEAKLKIDEYKHNTDLIAFFEAQTVEALSVYLTHCYRYSHGLQWIRYISHPTWPWKTVADIMQSIANNCHSCFRLFLNGYDRKKFYNLSSLLEDAKENPSLINIRAYSIAFTHLLNALIKGDMHPPTPEPKEQGGREDEELLVNAIPSKIYRKILDKIREHLREKFKTKQST